MLINTRTKTYPLPDNEDARLAELYKLEILDTQSEEDFNNIVALASEAFAVPVGMISLVDRERQWFKARKGLIDCEMSRNHAVCAYAILQDDVFEINDLRADKRFCNMPYVTGEPFLVYYAGVPLVSSEGLKIGTMCVMDTVPRKLTKEQKILLHVLAKHAMSLIETRVKNRYLQVLVQSQEKMLSLIGHDMKNPLLSLKMLLELDEQGDLEIQERADLLQSLKHQTAATLGMLGNLIDWGKLQMQQQQNTATVDLTALTETLFYQVKIACEAKNNLLINLIPAGTQIEQDAEMISFVLRNLLTNANKFTDGGTLVVSYVTGEGKNFLQVSDTGIGMTPQQIENMLYQPKGFHSRGTRGERGNGLGLTLVRQFLEKHGSCLHFESTAGAGTTVSFEV